MDKRKAIGAAVAAAAIAVAVKSAHEIHKRGYDRKAVSMLKGFALKLAKEAENLEKKMDKADNKKKKKK